MKRSRYGRRRHILKRTLIYMYVCAHHTHAREHPPTPTLDSIHSRNKPPIFILEFVLDYLLQVCFGYLYMYLLLEICSTLYLYCFNNIQPEGEGGGRWGGGEGYTAPRVSKCLWGIALYKSYYYIYMYYCNASPVNK